MSFSSDAKNEIISSGAGSHREEISCISGMLCFGGRIVTRPGSAIFRFSTENPKIARYLYTLIKKVSDIKVNLLIHKNIKTTSYYVSTENTESVNKLLSLSGLIRKIETYSDFKYFHISPSVAFSSSEKKAFLKGAFLACGSVISPQKRCHLEFVTDHYKLSRDFEILLSSLGFEPKTVIRKSNYVSYFKSSNEIADILTILGTYNCLMEYHNIKIMKEISNSINRKMNCDNANITKTLNASFKQAEAIRILMKNGALYKMSDQIQEIARLRLENKDLSLSDLGAMLNPPLGKSGVNHRLRKIMEEAEKYI